MPVTARPSPTDATTAIGVADHTDGAGPEAAPVTSTPLPSMPMLPDGWTLGRMQAADLDAVAAMEQRAYRHPWSRNNFADSLGSGHIGLTLRDGAGELVAYTVLMPVVDEMHLLNLTVDPSWQRRGLGRMMLEAALTLAREHRLPDMLLEVRPSNGPALALYRGHGFVQVGRRRNYYPADNGEREDALVLRRRAPQPPGCGDPA